MTPRADSRPPVDVRERSTRSRARAVAVALAAMLTPGLAPAWTGAPAGAAVSAGERAEFARIAGESRIETAAGISRAHFEPGVGTAYVARAGDFPDALAAGPLAAAAGGPILLTHAGSLPDATAEELARLRPRDILVLGGGAAVSGEVARRLEAFTGGSVRRAAGADRFETAAAIATAGFSAGVPVAYIATGIDFPDALAGGVAAAREGGPILLVTSNTVPPATADALRALRPARIVLLGGRGAVSDRVAAELGRLSGGPVERLAGPDRIATAAAVSRRAFPERADEVFIATGLDFPDSLAGVPAAYQREAPLLLVAQRVTEPLADELVRLCPSKVTVLGGRHAVPSAVVDQVEQALTRPRSSPPPDDDPAGLLDVWYGRTQAVGRHGQPQERVNVLGSAGPAVANLWYQHDGGRAVRLRRGPDGRRLVGPGDFNAEIPFANLCPGVNRITLTAADGDEDVIARRTIVLDHDARGHVPQPAARTVSWGSAGRIDAVAQVVDGVWQLQDGAVRSIRPGYDRLIAIGDRTWTDYEVTTPVRVHGHVGDAARSVGFALRWTGHTLRGRIIEPRWGYYPLGALATYDFQSTRLEIQGNSVDGRPPAIGRVPAVWDLGVTYVLKARVQTLPGGGSRYRLKMWPQGESEPAGWDLALDQPAADDHPAGSILLLAHNVDASFGNVTVRRL